VCVVRARDNMKYKVSEPFKFIFATCHSQRGKDIEKHNLPFKTQAAKIIY
jgi:hypothetical protein